MKIFVTIIQIALLVVFYLVGDWLQRLLHLPIPGSIIGMLLLFICLLIKAVPLKWIETGAGFLLTHLTLFFIPVTVGVMNHYQLFAGSGVFLFFITLFSTICVMVSAGLTANYFAKRKKKISCQKHSS